jgi:hypothetical protein
MTKQRSPLTFENALTTVASLIGWAAVAQICRKAETTVRNWSDPDTSAAVTLDAALELDKAYLIAGGEGAPFQLCYSIRLDADTIDACPERDALIASAGKIAKESGEAVEATIFAARAGATLADSALAERELEESIAAQTTTLARLRAARGSNSFASADRARVGEGVE